MIRRINSTLIKIVVATGGDVQILPSHTAAELYAEMKDRYAPGIRNVNTEKEMREHYDALSGFEKDLKKLSLIKK